MGKLPESEPWRATLAPLHRYTPYATTYRYATPGGRVPPAPDPTKIAHEAEEIASLIAAARKELVGAEG